MQYYIASSAQFATTGLNNLDRSCFEVSNIRYLSATNAYTDVNKMLRIHTDAGNEGIVDFNHQSRVRAYLAADQTNLADGAWTQVKIETRDYDEKSEYDLPTYTFTAKATGYYQVNARAEFAFPNAIANDAYVSIRIHYGPIATPKNSDGNNLSIKGSSGGAELLNNNAPVVGDVIYLQVGETMTVEVFQKTGGTQTVLSGSSKTYVSIHKLS